MAPGPPSAVVRYSLLITMVPRREISKCSISDTETETETEKSQIVIPLSESQTSKDSNVQMKNPAAAIMETHASSITHPSICGTITNFNNTYKTSDFVSDDRESNTMPLSHVESQLTGTKRKVQFSMANNAPSHEMEWDTSNQVESQNCILDESEHQNFQNMESDINFMSDSAPMLLKRARVSQNNLHQFRNFLSQPATQSSMDGARREIDPVGGIDDPDMFYKVNGKLYQRLNKIGSGGSSEVHKVISSDCKIYALKKIKLKGRDYATAYGFCQEILYLNKLKGKRNIIQLIDYEVTDKSLLREVMNGSTHGNKDGRVKDDGYIYMVLEYGEIDLAHYLSQKWKETDSKTHSIDENWLRFYWQVLRYALSKCLNSLTLKY